jgi:hypothetical protein
MKAHLDYASAVAKFRKTAGWLDGAFPARCFGGLHGESSPASGWNYKPNGAAEHCFYSRR